MSKPFTSICAFCHYEHDCTSQLVELGSTKPEAVMSPGDATLCISCGEINILGKDQMLRKPTRKEQRQLDRDERIIHLRAAWNWASARMRQ